ncbi:MAG: MBL fold metallo-hydrolase [Oscillospiraceae bacterium]|nr:MBL fold metallo-hydrolase [Oscillospiraceae bacterium]
MPAFAVTLRSGSSGNCALVSDGTSHVLIDCGLSLRALTHELAAFGLTPGMLTAILLTHEHTDHTRLLTGAARAPRVPVLASRGTLDAARLHDNASVIETERPVSLGRMLITRFDTPHDAAESCGYVIELTGSRGGARVGVCTDLGKITQEVAGALAGCEYIILESNHDVELLNSGPYPLFLRRRILSGVGHLSNDDCAGALPGLAAAGARRVTLAHLSERNNDPSLALGAAAWAALNAGLEPGRDIGIDAAPRFGAGGAYIF